MRAMGRLHPKRESERKGDSDSIATTPNGEAMHIDAIVRELEKKISRNRQFVQAALDEASSAGHKNLSIAVDAECTRRLNEIDDDKEKLERAKRVQAEENEIDRAMNESRPTSARSKPAYDEVARIGSEARVYSRADDPEGKGTSFLTDVIGAYRGNPQSNERLSRHAREYEVDNKGRQSRAAGDVTTGALPNLIVPAYLTELYAARPSNARPFADICRPVTLPAEGQTVELATGNTSATAALQTSQLVAVGGGNYDANPLTLNVQTAEAWQLVSRQAIDRGKVTENCVMGDMLDQMGALLDSTLITQATTGLYDSGTRIVYDSASPTVAELYPFILQGASKVSQALLNRGRPSHVLMHPRRWFWLQSLFSATWPMFSQPGVPAGQAGTNTANSYGNGVSGRLPCGLDVVVDNSVQTAALAGAQTGGTQDIVYVVAQDECILMEAPNREVFIRAEAPAANQLGVMLVCYEYFAYTFSRYGATAVQRINGTGSAPPSGF